MNNDKAYNFQGIDTHLTGVFILQLLIELA